MYNRKYVISVRPSKTLGSMALSRRIQIINVSPICILLHLTSTNKLAKFGENENPSGEIRTRPTPVIYYLVNIVFTAPNRAEQRWNSSQTAHLPRHFLSTLLSSERSTVPLFHIENVINKYVIAHFSFKPFSVSNFAEWVQLFEMCYSWGMPWTGTIALS